MNTTKNLPLSAVMGVFLLLLSVSTFGQDRTVTGTITDKDSKDPIPLVAILIEGTTKGTVADFDGNYTINVPDENAVLIFKSVSYKTLKIKVGKQKVINVELETDAKLLEGDFIVVGYGKMKKSEVTGSISSVSGDDLSGLPVPKIGQALQGKVAGVNITQNSGAPGSSLSIQIRGTGTINNSDPLYVVDGIVVDGIDNIPPESIKSIEILKDAAASAVYGARAANGVVLVTTRRGKSGKTKIPFSAYVAVQNYWKRLEVMDAYQFAIINEIANNNFGNANLLINTKTIDDYKKQDYNWLDEISRQGIVQKYNLAISGGNDKINYYVSGNMFDNQGIIMKSDFSQKNFTFDFGAELSPAINVRVNLQYTDDDRSRVDEGGNSIIRKALARTPDVTFYNENYQTDYNLNVLNAHTYRTLKEKHDQNKGSDIQAKLFFDFQLHKNLTFTSRGSFRKTMDERFIFSERNDQYNYRSGPNAVTSLTQTSSQSFKYFWENILNYNYKIKKHNIQFVGAVSVEDKEYSQLEGKRQGSLGNNLSTAYLSTAYIGDKAEDDVYSWSAMGVLGKLNYSYDSRYLLQIVSRADASSRFSKENRWGVFPSVALGWRASQESFLKDKDWLNLKLRLTWGKNGNSRIDNYATYNLLSTYFRYVYGSEDGNNIYDGVAATTVANPDIKWESTTTYNAGADVDFLQKQNLTLNADIYLKRTTDMLLRVPIVPSSGLSSAPFRNTGEVENKGFEFVLTYSEKERNINYDIGVNFSTYKNKVISLGELNEPVWGADLDHVDFVTKTQIDHPIGEFFGYKVVGVFNTEEEIAASAQKDIAEKGDFKFLDLNKDNKIDDADRMPIGSPHPDFTAGLSLKASYKGFDVSVFFFGVYGNDIFNKMSYYMKAHNGTNMLASNFGEFWNSGELVGKGGQNDFTNDTYFPVNTNSNLPRVRVEDGANRNYERASDFYIEDGSYLRLKDTQIGYSVPNELCKRLNISNIRLYMGAQNLLTFTNYSGLDPEIGKVPGSEGQNLSMGVDLGNYPQSRIFFFGINVGL